MILHIKARVQSGHQIVIPAEGFHVGQDVDITVQPAKSENAAPPDDILAFIDSLPPGPRSGKTWEEVERNFRKERDAWINEFTS